MEVAAEEFANLTRPLILVRWLIASLIVILVPHFWLLLGIKIGLESLLVLICTIGILNFLAGSLTSSRIEIIRQKFGLSHRNWKLWWSDRVKANLISILTNLIIFTSIYFLTSELSEPHSMIMLCSLALLGTFSLSFLIPVLITPIFTKLRDIPVENELRSRVLMMAEQLDIKVKKIQISDASRRGRAVNAYVAGIGKTRRVVLFDTLVNSLPLAEVEVVLAHEFAHVKSRDVFKSTLMFSIAAALSVVAMFQFLSPSSPYRFSVQAISFFAGLEVIFQPLALAISRRAEINADRRSMDLIPDLEVFTTMHRSLAGKNLIPLSVPKWFYFLFSTHPTLEQRLRLVT